MFAQERVRRFELAHLSVRTQPKVAVSRILQIGSRDRLKAAPRVKVGSQLLGQRLVLNEAVFLCRINGAFIELFRLEMTAFDAGQLRRHQELPILKVLGAGLRPEFQLLQVRSKIEQ